MKWFLNWPYKEEKWGKFSSSTMSHYCGWMELPIYWFLLAGDKIVYGLKIFHQFQSFAPHNMLTTTNFFILKSCFFQVFTQMLGMGWLIFYQSNEREFYRENLNVKLSSHQHKIKISLSSNANSDFERREVKIHYSRATRSICRIKSRNRADEKLICWRTAENSLNTFLKVESRQKTNYVEWISSQKLYECLFFFWKRNVSLKSSFTDRSQLKAPQRRC